MLAAVLTVPVLGLALLGVEVELARRGPRLPDRRLELSGRVGAGRAALRVVWLGDSTAAGVGASSAAASLPRRVAEELSRIQGGRPVERAVELTVLAVSGATVSEVVADQLGAVPPDVDAVFVSAGSNDVTHLTSRGDLRRDYRRLVAGLPAGTPVVALGVPDFGGVPRLAQPLRAVAAFRARQLDDVIRDVVSASGAAYVDIAGQTGPAFRREPGRMFASDEYHPSDDGYALWAGAVLEIAGRIGL